MHKINSSFAFECYQSTARFQYMQLLTHNNTLIYNIDLYMTQFN